MKGISPLVAVVLLIAVTMTIAGVLAYWAAGWVGTRLPSDNTTQRLVECPGANFDIVLANYNSTSKNMTIILQNKADVELLITNITFIYADGTLYTQEVNRKLPSGNSMISFVVSGIAPNYSSYNIFTNCPNVYRSGT